MLGENILHHVRRLRRLIGGERVFSCVVISHNRAPFKAHAGVATEVKSFFHHHVGASECLVHATGVQLTMKAQVVA